jgi:hypothetical protein
MGATLVETKRPPGGGRRKSGIAGARYEGVPTTAFRIEEIRALNDPRERDHDPAA